MEEDFEVVVVGNDVEVLVQFVEFVSAFDRVKEPDADLFEVLFEKVKV